MLEDPITLSYYTRGTASSPFSVAKLFNPKTTESSYYTETRHASGRLSYRDDYLFRLVKQSDGLLRPSASVRRTKYADEDGAVGWIDFISSTGFVFQPNFDEDSLVAALARNRMISGWMGSDVQNTNLTRLTKGEL